MVNKDGKTVSPTSEAFQAAAANADWKSQPGYGVILANQPGEKSWPMTAATWILVYKQPQDAAATAEALKFFAWALRQGRQDGRGARLRPDAEKVVTDIEKTWAAEIKDAGGKPLFTQLSRTEKSRKGARWAPFLLRIQHARKTACAAASLTA